MIVDQEPKSKADFYKSDSPDLLSLNKGGIPIN